MSFSKLDLRGCGKPPGSYPEADTVTPVSQFGGNASNEVGAHPAHIIDYRGSSSS